MLRIGHGIDIHRLQAGRKLILAGVEIPHTEGLLGHSDADVILHAVADALLGAVALGDLGKHFPGDEKNKDRASGEILHETVSMVWELGWKVVNVDVTLLADAPKVAPYIEKMRENIAKILSITLGSVSVKASTCEGLGFIGRREGMEAHAMVLLVRRDP